MVGAHTSAAASPALDPAHTSYAWTLSDVCQGADAVLMDGTRTAFSLLEHSSDVIA